jgi:hypothetical protein
MIAKTKKGQGLRGGACIFNKSDLVKVIGLGFIILRTGLGLGLVLR